MIAFDDILPVVGETLNTYRRYLKILGPLVVNRDLNGRVRLVLDGKLEEIADAKQAIDTIVRALVERLGVHGFPVDRMVLFESSLDAVKRGAPSFPLEGFDDVTVVDRLATETDWGTIAPVSYGVPRIVFFSIKGGVGRSTAISAAAWSLAEAGKRVLVLDMDLESPGISSSLLPDGRRPVHGITDWLVEDLVGNGGTVLESMVATSDLSHDGEIYVVPAHGRDPGEYVVKLGRVWMSKMGGDGSLETWSGRLNRLLRDLENRWMPDVILIDSRAGIDEVASACITDLGAKGVLLFSMDDDQAWSGYNILFRHWCRTGVVRDIRERLQLVGAMIPEENRMEYFDSLLERSWNVFSDELYDEVPPGDSAVSLFSFDRDDETAPHFPWPIRWNTGFAALRSIHSRFRRMDRDMLAAIFGRLLEGVHAIAEGEGVTHD